MIPSELLQQACNLCGHRGARLFLADRYHLDDCAFHWVRCGGCGVIRIAPLPTTEQLERMYADDEYAEGDSIAGHTGGRSAISGLLYADARAQLQKLAAHAPSGRLLDVGCAHGEMLQAAADLGYEPEGIEPNPTMARAAESHGFVVHRSDLEQADLSAERYHLIMLNHVLEHLTDPPAMMRKVYDLLAPGGVVQVRVPTALNSLYFKLPVHLVRLGRTAGLGSIWQGHKPPYHLWEFTPRLLRMLLQTAGFHVLHCEATENLPHLTRGDQSGVRLWHLRGPRDLLRVAASWPLKALSVAAARVSSLGDHSEIIATRAAEDSP